MMYMTVVLGALAIVALPVDAKAYLDPGTGSYVVQVLIAAVVGALFAVRIFFANFEFLFDSLFVGECGV